MKSPRSNQLWILLTLCFIDVVVLVLSENSATVMRFLEWAHLDAINSFGIFSCFLISLLSAIAFALNHRLGTEFHPNPWFSHYWSIAVSVAYANIAYWAMLMPTVAVLLQFGLMRK